ncbi:FIG00431650: hypothetical protein [plant metagenome]
MALRYDALQDYCDDPARTGDVQVILYAHYWKGFALAVQDGTTEHPVMDDKGRP